MLADVDGTLVRRTARAREMSDEDAYMALALNNAQGELHALEVGLHALRSPVPVREYQRQSAIPHRTLRDYIAAAEVCAQMRTEHDYRDRWRHLAGIHAAPRWLWHALIDAAAQ